MNAYALNYIIEVMVGAGQWDYVSPPTAVVIEIESMIIEQAKFNGTLSVGGVTYRWRQV